MSLLSLDPLDGLNQVRVMPDNHIHPERGKQLCIGFLRFVYGLPVVVAPMRGNNHNIRRRFCRCNLLLHGGFVKIGQNGVRIINGKPVCAVGICQKGKPHSVFFKRAHRIVIRFVFISADHQRAVGKGFPKGNRRLKASGALIRHVVVGNAHDIKPNLAQIIAELLRGIESGIAGELKALPRHQRFLIDKGNIRRRDLFAHIFIHRAKIIGAPLPERRGAFARVDINAGVDHIIPGGDKCDPFFRRRLRSRIGRRARIGRGRVGRERIRFALRERDCSARWDRVTLLARTSAYSAKHCKNHGGANNRPCHSPHSHARKVIRDSSHIAGAS